MCIRDSPYDPGQPHEVTCRGGKREANHAAYQDRPEVELGDVLEPRCMMNVFDEGEAREVAQYEEGECQQRQPRDPGTVKSALRST